MLFYSLVCLSFSVLVGATNSPVLIWSPSRSLKDLPQSYAGHTVSTEKFHENYLSPLAGDISHNTVVFLQDKLSLEDFTHHADVYNPSSEGGAFKNIKSAMDDQFSVHLSAVEKPEKAIDSSVSFFPGEIVKVDNPDQLNSLELKEGKKYMILVTLPSTRGKDEAKAFAENDAVMGRCMHHMNKRGIKYTALYTASSAQESGDEAVHQGRHLLADNTPQGNGTFQNTSNTLLYLTGVSLTVGDMSTYLPADDTSVTMTDNKENATIIVNLTIKNEDVSLQILMHTDESKYHGEWIITSGKANVTGLNSNWTKYDTEVDMLFDMVTAPYRFGYHCSALKVVSARSQNTNETDKNQTSVSLSITGFQFEPYYNMNNHSSGEHFGNDVWDCVPFFTVPIWMGIISTSVLMIILFFGLTMISNIKTMDRFDDPKGKTITVNVMD